MLTYCILFFILVSKVNSCSKKETSAYLDIAIQMLDKIKENPFNDICLLQSVDAIQRPLDCSDILHNGQNVSGVYVIWPSNREIPCRPVTVYCDMDTDGGGWTVIQRRGNFNREREYFYRDWQSYKQGFGRITEDFWLGNDIIFALTNQKSYSVRFDMRNKKSEERYAVYDSFWIDDEFHNYTLHIADYSGNAGEAMSTLHNLRAFSTKDRDNDGNSGNCARQFFGGWWYGTVCHHVNLNGLYGDNVAPFTGIHWARWTGRNESLEFTEMKIRPLMTESCLSLNTCRDCSEE